MCFVMSSHLADRNDFLLVRRKRCSYGVVSRQQKLLARLASGFAIAWLGAMVVFLHILWEKQSLELECVCVNLRRFTFLAAVFVFVLLVLVAF